jgi:hypothetical protein
MPRGSSLRATITKLAELSRYVGDASRTYGASTFFIVRRFAGLYVRQEVID